VRGLEGARGGQELEDHVPALERVPVRQHEAVHADAVHERPVLAAEIHQEDPVALTLQPGVLAGQAHVEHTDRVVFGAANGRVSLGQGVLLLVEQTWVHDQPHAPPS
jgi:hypothetical protein